MVIPITSIPQLACQPDWTDVIKEVFESTENNNSSSFWLSLYSTDGSIHDHVKVSKNGSDLTLQSDSFFLVLLDERTLEVTSKLPQLDLQTIIKAPKKTSTKLVHKKLCSFDVSPEGSKFVMGYEEGHLQVHNALTNRLEHHLSGHFSDITTCKFFPSGKVILSGSADFQLRIWSAENGSNPVVLKGHRQGITDCCMVERGRNILSSSRDGTIRLFDCGSMAELRTVFKTTCPINQITLASTTTKSSDLETNLSDSRECGTENKLVYAALDNGLTECVDIRQSQSTVYSIPTPMNAQGSAISLGYDSTCHLLATGYENGYIQLCDIRQHGTPLKCLQRGHDTITCLTFANEGHTLYASTGNGSCFEVELEKGQLKQEFSGLDCDPAVRLIHHQLPLKTYLAGKYDGRIFTY